MLSINCKISRCLEMSSTFLYMEGFSSNNAHEKKNHDHFSDLEHDKDHCTMMHVAATTFPVTVLLVHTSLSRKQGLVLTHDLLECLSFIFISALFRSLTVAASHRYQSSPPKQDVSRQKIDLNLGSLWRNQRPCSQIQPCCSLLVSTKHLYVHRRRLGRQSKMFA